jgi:hypothetical protein
MCHFLHVPSLCGDPCFEGDQSQQMYKIFFDAKSSASSLRQLSFKVHPSPSSLQASSETLAAREPCIVWKRSNGGRQLPIRFPVQRRYRLEKKKIFPILERSLCWTICSEELEATLSGSHLLARAARCIEASAHHNICSWSCSLPSKGVSVVWGA